jgi:hypothetical protein
MLAFIAAGFMDPCTNQDPVSLDFGHSIVTCQCFGQRAVLHAARIERILSHAAKKLNEINKNESALDLAGTAPTLAPHSGNV